MPAAQSNGSAAGPTPAVATQLESQVTRLEREIVSLQEAVRSRTLIGTAIGILAERYGCTTAQAWALIGRVSSHTNVKARDIARVVVAAADGSHDAGDRVLLDTLAPHLPGLVRTGRAAGPTRVPAAGSSDTEDTTA